MVVIPYISMHGSTQKMVRHLVEALTERGVTVKQFDLTVTDIGKPAMALVDEALGKREESGYIVIVAEMPGDPVTVEGYACYGPTPLTEIPSAFRLIDAALGIQLYRKEYEKGSPDFVQVIDLMQDDPAQKAADTIAGHRRVISPSYQDLLGSGRFDPTNPQHLTYAQAMNLENYLYMAVTAFGLIQVVDGGRGFYDYYRSSSYPSW
jgi:hypothetical protein